MRPVTLAALACLAAGSLTAADPVGAATPATESTSRLIVQFAPGTPESVQAAAHRSAGSGGTGGVRELRHLDMEIVELPAGADPQAALAAYRSRPDVVVADVDGPVRKAAAPNDPLYPVQWNLQPVSPTNRGTANWEPVFGLVDGTGSRVAVLDTGFLRGGDDEPLRIEMGRDHVREGDDDPTDEDGHGTHVIGTIAQRTNNGVHVAGVAPGATVIVIRVLDEDGQGTVADVIAGLDEAVERGAHVANLSLAGPPNVALCAAVDRASETTLVVAAAGNESSGLLKRPVAFPAACPSALAVGALRRDGSVATYSNQGDQLDIAAPGGQDTDGECEPVPESIVQETFAEDGELRPFCSEGTSMAAAHVAGAAALVRQADPEANLALTLQLAARDLGPPGPDDETGAGALDIAQAVGLAPALTADRYWMSATDGGIFAFGQAGFFGSTGNVALNQPIVGMAVSPKLDGYWLVASDGGIFAFGGAKFQGSTGAFRLNQPIVGMARTRLGDGYWLVARDGGIFAFGGAKFFGSTGAFVLNQPIVGMAPTPSGEGYWLVARDGGIFSFGDARFFGSTGAIALNQPIVAMAATPSGEGYWLVAADGGIFAFGDARFHGSTGAFVLNQPIVGMAATPKGDGYWLVARDGGIFAFGQAPFLGSTGNIKLNQPIVAIAAR